MLSETKQSFSLGGAGGGSPTVNDMISERDAEIYLPFSLLIHNKDLIWIYDSCRLRRDALTFTGGSLLESRGNKKCFGIGGKG